MAGLNGKPGLTPLKIYSGSVLLTQYVNKLTLSGSGIGVTVGKFNDVTLSVTGGGTSTTASYALTASFAETALTASYFSGTVVSASYSETASYALRVDGGTF
jgi:hypothetical protein